MKVYAISDLHLSLNTNKPMSYFGGTWKNYLEEIKKDWMSKVNDEDVVLIAGDISWSINLEEAADDLNWIMSLPGNKVMIRGNHDYWWKGASKIRQYLDNKTFIIQNDSVLIGDYVFCGTRGWTIPEEKFIQDTKDKKILDREYIRLKMSLDSAIKLKSSSKQKIISLIHFPPFNSSNPNNPFTRMFEEYKISSVVYGHLHGTKHKKQLVKKINGINYYLTACDQIQNKLIEIK